MLCHRLFVGKTIKEGLRGVILGQVDDAGSVLLDDGIYTVTF
ncbi:MAG: hypothetical protein RLP44_09400 [Aggregatilineales bacterium]